MPPPMPSSRRQRLELAERLRAEGRSWVEVADELRQRWPELTVLAAVRLAHGWTQQQAADAWTELWPDQVRVAKDIGLWENWPGGRGRRPSLSTLDKLAQLYQCSLSDLVADVSVYRHLDTLTKKSDPTSSTAATVASAPDDPSTEAEAEEWELAGLLSGLSCRLGEGSLADAEAAAVDLDHNFGRIPAAELAGLLKGWLLRAGEWLQQPLPVGDRSRVCSVTARIAGLYGWWHFDLAGNSDTGDAWYLAAATAAAEAGDADTEAWLLGCRSLILTDRDDDHAAAIAVGQAAVLARQHASATTRAWIGALEARSAARLGDQRRFAEIQHRADGTIDRTSPDEGRHGIDFADGHVDLSYYQGLGHLALGDHEPAQMVFTSALGALPVERVRARAMLHATLASTAHQAGDLDTTAARLSDAIDLTNIDPGARVVDRVRTVADQLISTDPSYRHDLASQLNALAALPER